MLLKQRMKYRLVKRYPGSPELGTILEMQPGTNMYFYNRLQVVEIEKFPEFWQPTDELTSELTNSPKGSLHWLNTNMGFVLRVGESISTKEHPSNYYVEWGKEIEKIAKETMEYFKDKLK